MSYKKKIASVLNELNNGTGNLVINDTIRKIDYLCCWEWENWQGDLTGYHPGSEKPKFPTESFIDDWVDKVDFKEYGFEIEELADM